MSESKTPCATRQEIMWCASRKNQYEEIVRGLRDEKHQKMLCGLQQSESFLLQFGNWDDVVAFMRKGTSDDPAKDVVLRAIFRAHAETRDPGLRTALFAIFWPGLASIQTRKRAWDRDADARWSNVIWSFLKVVQRIDLQKRPDHLVQKVINDSLHGLYVIYRREWDRAAFETPMDPDCVADMAGAAEAPEIVAVELRDEQEAQATGFRQHLEAGRITEGGFHALVSTRVYGRPLRECAEERGISFHAAKQRRLRAQTAIRRHGEAKISREGVP